MDEIFECRLCGECCKGYGGTYVTPEDIQAIARYLGVDSDGFVGRFCQLSGGKPLLAQGQNGYCIFLKERACRIHPVKPRMCRTWPFLRSVLRDIRNWEIMAETCPGINTRLPRELIRSKVAQKIRERGESADV
jgi:Fe-S-cluster containining protein